MLKHGQLSACESVRLSKSERFWGRTNTVNPPPDVGSPQTLNLLREFYRRCRAGTVARIDRQLPHRRDVRLDPPRLVPGKKPKKPAGLSRRASYAVTPAGPWGRSAIVEDHIRGKLKNASQSSVTDERASLTQMSAPLLQKPDAKTRHAAVELAVIGLSGRHRASI